MLPITLPDRYRLKRNGIVEISVKSVSDMNQLQFQAELSTRVARKALDTLEAQGDQLVQMLESIPSASPSPTATSGLNIDIMV